MNQYDTDRMRRAASRIRKTGWSISDTAGSVRHLGNIVPDAMRGDAGDALTEALEALYRQISDVSGNLSALASTLDRYAQKFDEADAKISSLVRGR